jgi:hypothetical protein
MVNNYFAISNNQIKVTVHFKQRKTHLHQPVSESLIQKISIKIFLPKS